MSPASRQPSLSGKLAKAAADYQASAVIPHCPNCHKPCCRLDTLVLDLEWKQVKLLWQRQDSRSEFDRVLDAGQGPVEIRRANGRYYIHSKPCPAYDEARPGCRIYGQPLKPTGCSDFPVYEDQRVIIADLRCEAVNLDSLKAAISEALGSAYRIAQKADPEFPFLVELTARARKPER